MGLHCQCKKEMYTSPLRAALEALEDESTKPLGHAPASYEIAHRAGMEKAIDIIERLIEQAEERLHGKEA